MSTDSEVKDPRLEKIVSKMRREQNHVVAFVAVVVVTFALAAFLANVSNQVHATDAVGSAQFAIASLVMTLGGGILIGVVVMEVLGYIDLIMEKHRLLR